KIAGTVKFFDRSKGYGLITPKDSTLPDIYIPITDIRVSGYQKLNPGEEVFCHAIRKRKGLQAFRVIKLHSERDFTSDTVSPKNVLLAHAIIMSLILLIAIALHTV